jgi:glutamate synthase (NADPH/NADH) large chain
MTGGRAIILGATGNNFAAGMSGGVAYLWDPDRKFPARCNLESVDLERITDVEEGRGLLDWIRRHQAYTGSTRAAEILSGAEQALVHFVKVMPKEWKRVTAGVPPRAASSRPSQHPEAPEVN